MGEAERGDSAPRRRISYWCGNGHETRPSFSAEAQVPDSWECPRCGLPASNDSGKPPPSPRNEPYKTHLAYVKERRSDEEARQILDEALAQLRSRVAQGEVIL